jgi:hypothetical protein
LLQEEYLGEFWKRIIVFTGGEKDPGDHWRRFVMFIGGEGSSWF